MAMRSTATLSMATTSRAATRSTATRSMATQSTSTGTQSPSMATQSTSTATQSTSMATQSTTTRAQITIVRRTPGQRYKLYLDGELVVVERDAIHVRPGRHTVQARLLPSGEMTPKWVLKLEAGARERLDL